MSLGRSTDAELLRASGSDASAFRVLFDRHSPAMYRYFLKRTANPDDALDLCAETFTRAWCSRDAFEDRCDGDIGPWLFGIGRRVFFRSARSRRIETDARQRLQVAIATDRLDVPAGDSWIDSTEDELLAHL